MNIKQTSAGFSNGLFIPDQQIHLLDPRGKDPIHFIQSLDPHPIVDESDPAWRRRFQQDEKDRGDQKANPPQYWLKQDRVEFLSRLYPRLCITVDAGVGKSMAVQQLAMIREQMHPGHLVIDVEFANLRNIKALQFLDAKDAENCFLVQKIAQLAKALSGSESESAPSDHEEVRQFLLALIRRGELTLVVDALDQMNLADARLVAEQLKLLQTFYPNLRLVVAGRPNAVTQVWAKLFAKNVWHGSKESQLGSSSSKDNASKANFQTNWPDQWHFARITTFSDDQVKRYLSESRFELMERLGVKALFLPRTLKILGSLSNEEMQWVRTASDVYWISISKTFHEDLQLQNSDKVFDAEKLLPVISAMAWTALSTPGKSPETDFDGNGLRDFRERASENYDQGKVLERIGFSDAIALLNDLNLEALKMQVDATSRRVTYVKFGDATVRDFLAAHWIANHADPDSVHEFLFNHVSFGENRKSGREYYDFWKLLCEMPEKLGSRDSPNDLTDLPPARRSELWLNAISILFQKRELGNDHKIGLRPTEMLFRAWPTLMEMCGHLPRFSWDTDAEKVVRWNKHELQLASDKAQANARDVVSLPVGVDETEVELDLSELSRPAGNSEVEIVHRFLIEFPLIYHGMHAAESCHDFAKESKRIARSFNHSFLAIPPADQDGVIPSLSCHFSAETWGEETTKCHDDLIAVENPFQLHRKTVTEEVYQLFVGGLKKLATASLPVVEINWFDSWAVSLWVHGRLPLELEWEYACRADPGGEKGETEMARFSGGANRVSRTSRQKNGSNTMLG